MSDLIQYFESIADHYQHDVRQAGSRNLTDTSYFYFDAVRAWRKTNPELSVLDVCIGTGAGSQMLLHSNYDVHGVDGSPKMLELAAKNGFDKEKLSLADVAKDGLPFPDASFAVVLTADSLFYLKNATDVITEMFRVAKPGGLILLDGLLHKNKKKGVIECPNTSARTAHIPSSYIQNADAFDRACRRGGGTLRKVLYSGTDIVDVINCPVPSRYVCYSFTKK